MHSPAPTDAPIRVTARVEQEKVRVAVTDSGEGFDPPREQPPRVRERMTVGGYGLYVVDQAARRWGIDEEGGTRVWFEV
jgi:anti-sigma regulatory factor (Ser/Thr protein kinase)